MSNEVYNKIIRKFEKMDEYLHYLAELQKVNESEFVSDYHFFGLAERYLQLSIEIILDIGKMTVILIGLRRPENNQDTISILFNAGIISAELASRMSGIAGFRNILVHEYENIDRAVVYRKLKTNIKDMDDFKKEMLSYFAEKSHG